MCWRRKALSSGGAGWWVSKVRSGGTALAWEKWTLPHAAPAKEQRVLCRAARQHPDTRNGVAGGSVLRTSARWKSPGRLASPPQLGNAADGVMRNPPDHQQRQHHEGTAARDTDRWDQKNRDSRGDRSRDEEVGGSTRTLLTFSARSSPAPRGNHGRGYARPVTQLVPGVLDQASTINSFFNQTNGGALTIAFRLR